MGLLINQILRHTREIEMRKTSKVMKKTGGNSREAAIAVLRQAAERWPTSVVARRKILEFSGGLIAPGTAANHDSAGTGIPGAFRVGRQVVYPVQATIEWLIARLED